jgi:hypothetical protein
MNVRTALPAIVLVLLAVFATAFAFINYSNHVHVWPLIGTQPLTVVIGVAFLLGAGVGGLLIHILNQNRIPRAVVGSSQPSER